MPKLTNGKFATRKLLEANIIRMHNRGYSHAEVAVQCMVTKPTVSHILRRWKLKEKGLHDHDPRQSLDSYRGKVVERHTAINSWRAPPITEPICYVSGTTLAWY